jgi:feruloyl esterase
LADELIPAQGTIDYYKRVQQQMGGAEKTAQFARLFLAPGVDHGFRGAGPTPTGQMDAIVRWVEEGKAPDRLVAELRDKDGKIVRTRPLFPYPQAAKYKGNGGTDDAANFVSSPPTNNLARVEFHSDTTSGPPETEEPLFVCDRVSHYILAAYQP